MGRRHTRPSLWIAVSVLTSCLLTGGCNWFSSPKSTNVEKSDPAAAGATAAAQASDSTAGSPATTARRGANDEAKSRRPSQRRNATSPAASPDGITEAATPGTLPTPAPLASRAGEPVIAAAPDVSGGRPTFVDDGRSLVYSKADADVTPPKLLTVQNGGPTFRNMKMDVNTMELVISKQGRVEQVKLVTPVKRMTDMLLLSGAKTWRFSPALRNGQPVRYRTQYSWQTTP